MFNLNNEEVMETETIQETKIPKVSVIIPVYGVEKYIERCARSLFEQTLDDIEYLFIDDCTPDRSVEALKNVLEDYPQRKPQVTIHRMEQNSGQAKVREWGMRNAKGEYVIHCDSDDWVDFDAYEKVYERAKKDSCDLVYFDFKEEGVPNGREVRKPLYDGIKNDDVISLMLLNTLGLNPLWSVMMKRSLLDNDFYYPLCNQSEDWSLMIQILYYVKTIGYIDTSYYHYFINPTSIMHTPGREKVLRRAKDVENNLKLVLNFLEEKGEEKKYKWEIIYAKIHTRYFIKSLSKEKDYKQLWNSIFPEANRNMWFDKYISIRMKIYNLLVQII